MNEDSSPKNPHLCSSLQALSHAYLRETPHGAQIGQVPNFGSIMRAVPEGLHSPGAARTIGESTSYLIFHKRIKAAPSKGRSMAQPLIQSRVYIWS